MALRPMTADECLSTAIAWERAEYHPSVRLQGSTHWLGIAMRAEADPADPAIPLVPVIRDRPVRDP